MKYDFDMFSIMPDEVQQKFRGQINDLGLSSTMSEQMALWRDQQVVDALRRADPAVQQFFRDSGFGLNVFDSGAPTGRYPAYDEAARIGVMDKLTQNLPKVDLSDADWGGFDMGAFMTYLATATPIDQIDMDTPVPPPPTAPPIPGMAEPQADPSALLPPSQGSNRRGLAMIGLALGVILLMIAALMMMP